MRTTGLRFGAVVFIGALGCGGTDMTTNADAGAQAGDLSLSPGFVLATRTGAARGEVQVTSPCPGFYPSVAQYRMVLTAPTSGVSVTVESTETLAFMVRWGTSNFCSTGQPGRLVVQRGAWSAGSYDLLVGSPTSGGTGAYTVTVREQ